MKELIEKIKNMAPKERKGFFSMIYFFLRDFYAIAKESDLVVQSASISYYFVLALVPLLILLISFASILAGYISLDQASLEAAKNMIPGPVESILASLSTEVSANLSFSSLSLSLILILWAAGKSFGNIVRGILTIYPRYEDKFTLPSRVSGVILTLVFFLLITLTTIVISFGQKILILIAKIFSFQLNFEAINLIRYSFAFLLLFSFFLILYTMTSKQSKANLPAWPGALFTTFAWLAISYSYALYINNFANIADVYGSLSNIVVLLLWFNFSCQAILMGAIINRLFLESKERNQGVLQ